MSKMTREERLAAGWTLRWGLYDYADGRWLTTANHEPPWAEQPKQRHAFGSASAASKACVADGDASQTIPRIFWRRKKTRQFKMGDEVAVRGVVDGVEIARPGDTICAVRLRFRAAIPAEYMAWFHADALKSPKKAAK